MDTDTEKLGRRVIAIVNATRKQVLSGHKEIVEAIDKSTLDEYEADALLEFAELLLTGVDKDIIIDALQMPSELVEAFDKRGLEW